MINKKTNQKYLNFISEQFNKTFDFDAEYAARVGKASKVTCSAGATKNSLYGLFPPHKYVQILLEHENLGKTVTDEVNVDFKYYFDQEGKVTMLERFDPTSQYVDKLIGTIFVTHGKREIDAIFCKRHTASVSTVAQCKLDLYGRLARYMECTCGVNGYPYVYSVLRLSYVAGNVKIQHSVYSIWQDGDPILASERKYVRKRNGELRETTKLNKEV